MGLRPVRHAALAAFNDRRRPASRRNSAQASARLPCAPLAGGNRPSSRTRRVGELIGPPCLKLLAAEFRNPPAKGVPIGHYGVSFAMARQGAKARGAPTVNSSVTNSGTTEPGKPLIPRHDVRSLAHDPRASAS
jgi:hypothetical protein